MDPQHKKTSVLARLAMPLLVIGAPVLVVALYYNYFGADGRPAESSQSTAPLELIIPENKTAHEKQVAPVSELTLKLAKRLEANPNDASGWLLLAKSYKHTQQLDKAKQAYLQAEKYGATDTALENQLGINNTSSVNN